MSRWLENNVLPRLDTWITCFRKGREQNREWEPEGCIAKDTGGAFPTRDPERVPIGNTERNTLVIYFVLGLAALGPRPSGGPVSALAGRTHRYNYPLENTFAPAQVNTSPGAATRRGSKRVNSVINDVSLIRAYSASSADFLRIRTLSSTVSAKSPHCIPEQTGVEHSRNIHHSRHSDQFVCH